MITNIRNQAIYDYKFIKDINTIIQNYVFGNSKDNKSKELFKELEGLVLAESDKPTEYILWLYKDKVDEYLVYINKYKCYVPSGHINVSRARDFYPLPRNYKLALVHNIRNQTSYAYKFIKNINGIIQNYIFSNSIDNKSKELFKELEGLLLAKSEKPAEYILWLYEDKVDKYILYINTHPIKSLPKFPRFEFDDVLMLNF